PDCAADIKDDRSRLHHSADSEVGIGKAVAKRADNGAVAVDFAVEPRDVIDDSTPPAGGGRAGAVGPGKRRNSRRTITERKAECEGGNRRPSSCARFFHYGRSSRLHRVRDGPGNDFFGLL